MQNPIQKFRQSSIVFEKTGILSEKLKKYQLPQSSIILAKPSHTFPTYQCLQKGVQVCKYLQILKRPGFYTLVF